MITQQQPKTFGEQLAFVLTLVFGCLGFGIALLILAVIHDAIVKYDIEIKFFIIFVAAIFVFILIFFIAGMAHFSLRQKHLEIMAYEQNYLLPSTLERHKTVTIEQKADEEEFLSYTDKKTHEVYCEMLATDTFSLNKLAIEIYGNSGGKYNEKLKKSLAKFGVIF